MPSKNFAINGVTYLQKGQVGQGGVGTVFRATTNDGSAEFAIKVIELNNPKHPLTANQKERARREAKWCLDDHGENVIRLQAVDEVDDNLYLVMPLYKGTLRDVIKRGFDYEKSLDLMSTLCLTVDRLHASGVIHRDIKPENILIDEMGRPVLADFGIAHFDDFTNVTKAGQRLANRDYCAPEQRAAINSKTVTAAADTYALGMILFELLAGRPRHGSVIASTENDLPLPSSLGRLVDEMCAFAPQDRIPLRFACDEILKMLETFRADSADALNHLANIAPTQKGEGLLEQAVQDIFILGYLAESNTLIDSDIHNLNYHENIIFNLSPPVAAKVKIIALHSAFSKKFEYESAVYSPIPAGESWPSCYRDGPTEEMRVKLDEQLAPLSKQGRGNNDYHIGLIRKSFDSCSQNHCEELLGAIPEVYREVDEQTRGPALWVLSYLQHKAPSALEEVNAENSYSFFEPDLVESIPLSGLSENQRQLGARFLKSRMDDGCETTLSKLSAAYPSFQYWVRDSYIFARFGERCEFEDFSNLTMMNFEKGSALEADLRDLLAEKSSGTGSAQLLWEINFSVRVTLPKVVARLP